VVVAAGVTTKGAPLVAASDPGVITPVPFEKTPVRLVVPPDVIVVGLARKLVIVGVAAIVHVAVPLAVPALFVTVQPSCTEPEPPPVNVIWLVVPPAVIVPPVAVQAYVQPAWVGTEAVKPVALDVT
jgi:hypothetical protein